MANTTAMPTANNEIKDLAPNRAPELVVKGEVVAGLDADAEGDFVPGNIGETNDGPIGLVPLFDAAGLPEGEAVTA